MTARPAPATDFTQRFSFDLAPVRGRILRLGETWATLRSRRAYRSTAETLLADLAVASGLLAQDLKFDGSVITKSIVHRHGLQSPTSLLGCTLFRDGT